MTSKNKKPVIIISGATGTGKTSSAILLAEALKNTKGINCEVVNFDSVQFYAELDIASAKPDSEELSRITHHLIGVKSIQEEMNASEFCLLAERKIEELHLNNIVPILVGGSGFYVRAFVKGMFDSVSVSPKTRQAVEQLIQDEGPMALRERLLEVDKESFDKLHQNDIYRNSRALEHWIETGTKFSDKSKKISDPYDFTQQKDPNLKFLHLYAHIPKEEHFPILMKRTEGFFKDLAIIKEVQSILENGASGEEKALQSIGYKETIAYLKDQLPSPEHDYSSLIERIFISTRQLVKAQKTFFKKVHPKVEFNPIHDQAKILEHSTLFLDK